MGVRVVGLCVRACELVRTCETKCLLSLLLTLHNRIRKRFDFAAVVHVSSCLCVVCEEEVGSYLYLHVCVTVTNAFASELQQEGVTSPHLRVHRHPSWSCYCRLSTIFSNVLVSTKRANSYAIPLECVWCVVWWCEKRDEKKPEISLFLFGTSCQLLSITLTATDWGVSGQLPTENNGHRCQSQLSRQNLARKWAHFFSIRKGTNEKYDSTCSHLYKVFLISFSERASWEDNFWDFVVENQADKKISWQDRTPQTQRRKCECGHILQRGN